MNRHTRWASESEGVDSITPSEHKLFALALLGKPLPDTSAAKRRASEERERLEWLASISERHAEQLRRLELAEAEARRDRERLEWLAQISERHERKLREVLREEAEAKEAQARAERYAETLIAQEAWDAAKHPRRGGAPNAGWFSSTGGGGDPGATARSASVFDRIRQRNSQIAELSGVVTPSMIQANRLADELEAAARLPGDVARAAAAGTMTGGKAVVNGLATAVKDTATLGLSPGQLELIGVTQEDRARGYDKAVAIATGSGQVLIAAGTGGMASALSKGGSVARAASGALIAYDAAGNAVGVVKGVYDATQNGVTIANGVQIAAGGLGIAGNIKAAQSLKPAIRPRAADPGRGGPYGHMEDPPGTNSGLDFTPSQKRNILTENARQNGGVLKDDRTGEVLVPGQQRRRGEPAPPNEAQVDHVYPKSKGGPNTYSNAEVRSRRNNLRKGKNIE